MAEIDRQKERVAFWRNLFFVVLTALFGLSAFIFNNFDKLNEVRLIIIVVVTFLFAVSLILIAIKMRKETDKLRDL